jgi:hypothetical protein
MTQLTHLALHAEEMAVLIDALEADLDDYMEAAEEARDEGKADQAKKLTDSAQRVRAVLGKVRGSSSELRAERRAEIATPEELPSP